MLSEQEYKIVQQRFTRTTCRTVSEYARQILLARPITFNERNQSVDELLWELTRLRMDLIRIEANFELAAKAPISTLTAGELGRWLASCQTDRGRLVTQVEQIKAFITQTAQKWLQS